MCSLRDALLSMVTTLKINIGGIMGLLSIVATDRWGRKPIFLIGFGIFPIRGFLYTLSDDPFFIVAVQLLDGIGAGIFGVLWITVVADLTKGTGRYNLTLALSRRRKASARPSAMSRLGVGRKRPELYYGICHARRNCSLDDFF